MELREGIRRSGPHTARPSTLHNLRNMVLLLKASITHSTNTSSSTRRARRRTRR